MKDDFIGIYENAFPVELCNELIHNFEALKAENFVFSRQQSEGVNKLDKDTLSLFRADLLCDHSTNSNLARAELQEAANGLLSRCVSDYVNKYSVLQQPYTAPMATYTQKIQKTDVGGGYHIWHYEASDRMSSVRVLLFIVYLNDVEEGGETEFLYLHKRVKPKAGTVIIIPCGFTHAHRGNPPLSDVKYIMNGWLEF